MKPAELRLMMSRVLAGWTFTAAAIDAAISRISVSRIFDKLKKAGIYTETDLNRLSDEELLQIVYPHGQVITNENGLIRDVVPMRSNSDALIPDFMELGCKIIDQKKRRQELYFQYQDDCAAAGRPELGRSTFYRLLSRAVKELNRGSNAIMIIDHVYGEECQLDAAGTRITLRMTDGSAVKMYVLAVCWAASGLVWAGFIEELSTIEICLALGRAMNYFGVLPARRLVVDNAKAMVVRHSRGHEAIFNPTFANFMSEMGVDVHACNPYSPTEKSQIEYSVRLITERVLPRLDTSIPKTKKDWDSELQQTVEKYINSITARGRPMSRRERFEQYEKPQAKPLLQPISEVPAIMECTVGRNYHIMIKGHRYSVPYKYIGRHVLIKYTDMHVVVYCDGMEIARHQRSFDDGRTTADDHMPVNHMEYRKSRRRYQSDEELLQRAGEISPQVKQYCSWRLSRKDGQRIKACVGVMNFVTRTSRREIANQAVDIMMRGPENRRNIYVLREIYTELWQYAITHNGKHPRQTELDFRSHDEPETKDRTRPWETDEPEVFTADAAWSKEDEDDDNGGSQK